MSISGKEGPYVAHRGNMLGGAGTQSAFLNPDQGPSLFISGSGMLDPRVPFTYMPGQRPGQNTFGFISNDYALINQVPSAAAANNIALSQSPAAGAIVLTAGTGITSGITITRADNPGLQVSGLFAIDGAMLPLRFGDQLLGSICFWDPTKAVSRSIQIVSGGNDSGINFTVTGFDLYGYPMQETRAGGNAGASNFQKAFKYIQSVTHTGSIASTVTVGTTDVLGFPLRSDFFGDVTLIWNNTYITAATGYTAAVTTSPATAATGDVRGTWNLASTSGGASDGTKRIQLSLTPPLGNMNVGANVNGLFGVPQFTALNNGS